MDNPLIGIWRSERTLTLDWWHERSTSPVAFLECLARNLGKLELQFDRQNFWSLSKGRRSVRRYALTQWQPRRCEIAIYADEEEDERDGVQTFNFLSDELLWVPLGTEREYFRRVSTTLTQPPRNTLVEIDLSAVTRTDALHAVLRDELGFPGWYGCNWAAFWDAITGLVDMPLRLRFFGWQAFSTALPADAAALGDCLQELARQQPDRAALVDCR